MELTGFPFEPPHQHDNDRGAWPMVAEDSQREQFINPREMHTPNYSFDMHSQPSQSFQRFHSDHDVSLPASAAPSPYMHGHATPMSHVATPLSIGSGDDGGSSFNLEVAETDEAAPDSNEPYNKLLHRCLLEAPNYERLLKEIYEWFKQNTDKGRDPKHKGWQNSIRHNLSMNPAFQKGSRSQRDSGSANMWSLSDDAINGNVEPTTRFRNSNNKSGGRNKNRPSSTAHGAVRTTRQYARARSMHPYERASPRTTPQHQAPTSYPSAAQPADALPQSPKEALIENIGAWHNGVTAAYDTTSPYFISEQRSVQPTHGFCYHDGISDFEHGYQHPSSSFMPDFSTAMGSTRSQTGQPEFLVPLHPASEPFRPGYFHGQRPASSGSRGLVSVPRTPPSATPPLLDASQIEGVAEEARGHPLFSDDDSSMAEQDGLKTPPELFFSDSGYGGSSGYGASSKVGDSEHGTHSMFGP